MRFVLTEFTAGGGQTHGAARREIYAGIRRGEITDHEQEEWGCQR